MSRPKPLLIFALSIVLLASGFAPAPATGGDWPMWRYDARRTASSPEKLPQPLALQWSREYRPRQPVWDDPLNQDLMPYDQVFEPVVAGGRMVVGFNDSDKVVALSTSTGEELWRFYTDGPVRFPPAIDHDRVFVTSDDGFLYCISLKTGKLLWKQRGGPSDSRLIGNQRLISSWPARGGPVVVEGTVYFAASIWPMMGTFIYALDAETGNVLWCNESTAAAFVVQPHNNPAFAGVGPQGALAVAGERLLVPGGRTVPAVLDRMTGKQHYFHLGTNPKMGGSNVSAIDSVFLTHERTGNYSLFDLETGAKKSNTQLQRPVLTRSAFYCAGTNISAVDPRSLKSTWSIDADASGDLIQAGGRLYAGGKGTITVVELSAAHRGSEAVTKINVDGNVRRLLAADGRLFAVTEEGTILAFGAAPADGRSPGSWPFAAKRATIDPATARRADRILDVTGVRDGYALLYGVADGDLAEALVRQSKLHVIAVDPDAEKIARLRRRYDDAGLYGRQITLHEGTPLSFVLPPYISSLTVLGSPVTADCAGDVDTFRALTHSLRPYGGKLWIDADAQATEKLAALLGGREAAQLKLHRRRGAAMFERAGALAGSGDWTHQYGNIQNTIKSDDSLVKLPMGILWFGGSSNLDVLPRHGHAPPEQVIGGRCFVQGAKSVSARDVYTGRVLWKRQLDRLGTFGVYYDETYKETPLSTAYNQVHIPGANARGTNYVATEDSLYVLQQHECHVLDAVTGKTRKVFTIPRPAYRPPQPPDGKHIDWAYLGVYKDFLIGGDGFATFSDKVPLAPKDGRSQWRFTDFDKSASAAIVVMDRKDGSERWRIEAKHGFLHNAICVAGDTLFCLDKLPPYIEQKWERRGRDLPQTYRLAAIDMKTGNARWSAAGTGVFGTWLSYSKEHDLLLQATRPSRDTVRGEEGVRMIVYRAADGSVVWDKPLQYGEPPILHGDRIIAGGRAYYLKTGEQVFRVDPITGKKTPWTYHRAYGCNYAIASEHLLTFRSSAAGFFDLARDGGVGHFGGFKSSCTSSLVAAGGVLNAPDFTRTCSCSFQNQTSLALVHMPNMDWWVHTDFSYSGDPIERIGVNLGAAGDRRSDDGTLWLDVPSRGSPSPKIPVTIEGDVQYFQRHTSRIAGPGLPWVGASGLQGAAKLTVTLGPEAAAPDGAIRAAIAAESDDAEQSTETGEVTLDSTDLEMTQEKSEQVVGLRFAALKIPKNATIESASVQFQVDEASSAPAALEVYAQAIDNAATFAAKEGDLTGRKRSENKVAWQPDAWTKIGESGAAQRTPNLASLIEEIVRRPGWKSGNAIALLIHGKGVRVAKSFDGDSAAAPVLLVKLAADGEAADGEAGDSKEPARRPDPIRRYTVRLHFAETEDVAAGQRVFDVTLQDKTVLSGFDVAAAAGGARRTVVRQFEGIAVDGKLTVTLAARPGSRPPILCGIEAVRQPQGATPGKTDLSSAEN